VKFTTGIACAALVAALSGSVSAASLPVTPVSPTPDGTYRIGDATPFTLKTAPGAACTVTVHVPGAPNELHLTEMTANADGEVSWPSQAGLYTGRSEAVATCSLGNDRSEARWSYDVTLTPASVTGPVNPFLISPGIGIGPVLLGMSVTAAVAANGAPKTTLTEQDGHVRYYWSETTRLTAGIVQGGNGLSASADTLGIIVVIRVIDDPHYATAEGLHTGITEAQVRAAMGPPWLVNPDVDSSTGKLIAHTLAYPGIDFTIDDDPAISGYGAVAVIQVFPTPSP
jgi:hypothetical protein